MKADDATYYGLLQNGAIGARMYYQEKLANEQKLQKEKKEQNGTMTKTIPKRQKSKTKARPKQDQPITRPNQTQKENCCQRLSWLVF